MGTAADPSQVAWKPDSNNRLQTDQRPPPGLELRGRREDAAERCARAEAVALVSLARRLRVGVCRPIVAGIALVETIRKTGSSERSGSRKRETEDET